MFRVAKIWVLYNRGKRYVPMARTVRCHLVWDRVEPPHLAKQHSELLVFSMVAEQAPLIVSVARPGKIVVPDCILEALDESPPCHPENIVIRSLGLLVYQDVDDAGVSHRSHAVCEMSNHRKPVVASYPHEFSGFCNHRSGMELLTQFQCVLLAHLLSEIDQIIKVCAPPEFMNDEPR